MIGKGTQAALDMYRCAEDVVFDKEKIRDILEEAADRFSLKELALYATENDEGDDFCFVMLCTNGHLFLHVFPTYGYVEADIFTLESGANPEQVAVFLRQEFGPDQSKLTTLKRGDYGSIKDMKPQRKKMVKTMRRAKNAGAKLKKFMTWKNTKEEDGKQEALVGASCF